MVSIAFGVLAETAASRAGSAWHISLGASDGVVSPFACVKR